MWQRFFGPLAKIVGIDIQERSKSYEAPGTLVRVGDQADERFLQSLIEEFGIPDIVLDDGSHRMEHISKTFNFLYPKLPKNGVYMVEDLHTAYWDEYRGGLSKADAFINISKDFIDRLNIVLEKGEVWNKEVLHRGHKPILGK